MLFPYNSTLPSFKITPSYKKPVEPVNNELAFVIPETSTGIGLPDIEPQDRTVPFPNITDVLYRVTPTATAPDEIPKTWTGV